MAIQAESEQVGRVTGLDGDFALVQVEGGGCGRCHEAGGCGGQQLTRMFCSTPRQYRVRNAVGAKPGDLVSIILPAGALGRYATLAYGLPLLGLIVGALLGDRLGGEHGALLGGVAGCLAAFLLVRRHAPGSAGKTGAEPHIGQIKSSGG
ncbi:SoxR reducing system RseC family protein [Azovibrio restrictus]|uniref:SoxR reducing system RseC family protein n=1 Tax=Azovibrio restrictus TaxID=146938 RepID=UPI0026F1BBD0|nr:SoxR reducing system RseC family protein [Azovibrio restrictus]